MARPHLSTAHAIDFSTALLRSGNVNEYFDVVSRWLPRVVATDYHNFLITNPSTKTYLRHLSPGFPSEIFDDYSDDGASSDLVFKMARAVAPGSFIHLMDIIDVPGPAGWKRMRARLVKQIGPHDSITIVLHADQERGWGAGFTLWRVKPNPLFSEAEIDAVGQIGPMLAAAFGLVWNAAAIATAHETLTEIFFHAGNFTFLVQGNAAPVMLDEVTAGGLRVAMGTARHPNGLPAPLAGVVRELIAELKRSGSLSLISREMTAGDGVHRVYLTRAHTAPGGDDAYQVVVMCGPDFTDLKLLTGAGFTDREVEIIEHLQRGVSSIMTGKTLGISESTVKFHLRNIGIKLGATGKLEILARAIALSRELGVCKGIKPRPPVPPAEAS